ncbi:hypothetical protein MIR68_003920 [Amoeboaphelidium protococcarum]|nr:hypothetical protein MIR68_003920 [Amoeboaphelidium protococcarum]
MTLESLAKYTEDSINCSKELLNFFKKKSAMDAEYAKGLVKLCQTTLSHFQKNKSADKSQDMAILKSSLWSSFSNVLQCLYDQASVARSVSMTLSNDVAAPIQQYIREMEADRKAVIDEAMRQQRVLQDMFIELKKVKQNQEDCLQANNEAKEALTKAQRTPNVKDKELEKLQQKVLVCQEKLNIADATLQEHDENCKNAQQIYWQTLLPALLEKLYNKEEERCATVHSTLKNWCLMEKQLFEFENQSGEKRLDILENTDLSGDLEEVFTEHMNSSFDPTDDSKTGAGIPSISVHSLVNPIKSGRMLKKSDENDLVWKPRYFVLMGDRTDPTNPSYQPTSGRLYYFEQEDSTKPKGIVDLSGASVYSVDDTMSGGEKKNLFLISTSLTTTENNQLVIKKKILYLSAEREEEKDEWMDSLRAYSLCCMPDLSSALAEPVSLNLDSTEEVAVNFPRASPKEVHYRTIRTLSLWIMEVRDVHVLEPAARPSTADAGQGLAQDQGNLFNAFQGQKTYSTFCTVSVNEARIAKTAVKSGTNPFFGEEFYFDELADCESEIQIEVHSSGRRKNLSLQLGSLSVKLSSFTDEQNSQNHVHKKYEAWLPIQTATVDEFDQPERDGNPAVRIAAIVSNENILPLYEYPSFVNTLFGEDYRVLKTLARSAEKCVSFARDDFARSLVNVLIATDSDIVAFRALLSVDVEGTEDPNIIFRGNSMATKVIDQYMKIVCGEFLMNTLSAPIKLVYEKSSRQESCEIDPTRLERPDDELIKKHQKRLLAWAQMFWDAIQNSVEKCPKNMRETLQSIREMVVNSFRGRKTTTEKEMNNLNQVQYSSVSGFIFLRFFCPAILNPKLFGLWPEISDNPVASRSLTLIAKVMQNLANLSDFKGKEPHMEFCNPWITFNIDAMKTCILHFSTAPASDANKKFTAAVPTAQDVDLSRQLNYLYLQIINNHDDLVTLKTEVETHRKQGTELTLGHRGHIVPDDLDRLFMFQEKLADMYAQYHAVWTSSKKQIEECPHIIKPFSIINMSSVKATKTPITVAAQSMTPADKKAAKKTTTTNIKTRMISTPTLISHPINAERVAHLGDDDQQSVQMIQVGGMSTKSSEDSNLAKLSAININDGGGNNVASSSTTQKVNKRLSSLPAPTISLNPPSFDDAAATSSSLSRTIEFELDQRMSSQDKLESVARVSSPVMPTTDVQDVLQIPNSDGGSGGASASQDQNRPSVSSRKMGTTQKFMSRLFSGGSVRIGKGSTGMDGAQDGAGDISDLALQMDSNEAPSPEAMSNMKPGGTFKLGTWKKNSISVVGPDGQSEARRKLMTGTNVSIFTNKAGGSEPPRE